MLYYGRRAYEGFAKAFAQKMGVSVSISDTINAPCVDASGSIQLPAMDNYQSKTEFEDTCATIIHEISHVFYGTHKSFPASTKGQSTLFRDCLNAVMDVADETAISKLEISRGNHRCEQLLVMACTRALFKDGLRPDNGQFGPNNPKPAAHWRILATCLIKARCYGQKSVRIYCMNSIGRHLIAEYPTVDIAKVQAVLNGVRLEASKGDTATRATSHYASLVRAAWRLHKLLASVEPPQGQQPQNMPGGAGVAENGAGVPQGALGQGKPQLPAGQQEADEQDGEAMGGRSAAVNSPASGTPGSGSGGGTASSSPGIFNQDAFQTVMPVIRRVAQRIANDGDAINSEGGYTSGNSLSNPVAAMTDGACMGRWIIDSHADGMACAVLLDVSGSMSNMRTISGIAEAFASGMSDCAEVNRWTFGDNCKHRNNFREIEYQEGSTATDTGLAEAQAWLATQEAGQKVLVCITDGEPNNSSAEPTKRITAELIQAGVKVIGIALGHEGMQRDIMNSMPGVQVVQAIDPNRLAIQLERLSMHL